MVLGGELRPGERLNEVVIAESLGISRGPLREAIQRLASEGILTIVTHKGAYVHSVTEADLRELYELRIAIESYALRLGADRATDEQIAQLRAELDRTRDILEDSDAPYPSKIDIHEQFVSLAHNQALRTQTQEIYAQLRLARARSGNDPNRARAAYKEHVAILERITERDGRGAADLMEQHLKSGLDNALEMMRARA